MKKFLSVLLVLVIVLGCMLVISACGKEEESGETTEATTEPMIPQKEYSIEEVAAAAEQMSFTGTGMQTAYCPKCNKVVSWGEVTDTSDWLVGAVDTAHYYLAKDIKRTCTLFAYNGSACLFLNGKTITYDGSTEGQAKNPIIGGNGSTVFTVMGNGTLISENRACAVPNSGVLNICGGEYKTITDTDVTLRTNKDTSELNIYKAKVHGTVKYIADKPESKLYISGDVTMDNLLVESGLIEIGTLPEGSEIVVNADGVFTKDFESVEAAEAAAKCLVAEDDSKQIVVEGKALSCTAK